MATRRFSGTRLREARGDMRAEAVAGPVEISRETLRQWENGRSEPRASELAIIADLLGKPLDYFFESSAA